MNPRFDQPAETFIYREPGVTLALSVDEVLNGEYAWFYEGRPIGGATARTYEIDDLQTEITGHYVCVVHVKNIEVERHRFLVGITDLWVMKNPEDVSLIEGNDFSLECDVAPVFYPDNHNEDAYPVTYQWFVTGSAGTAEIPGAVAARYFKANATPGSDNGQYHCRVQLFDLDGVKIREVQTHPATVEVKVKVKCKPKGFIHPLPHRSTSFMWIGYWVFDEIKRCKREGIDWYTDFASTKYPKTIETLCYGLTAYGDVLMMESRNGYIYSARDFLL